MGKVGKRWGGKHPFLSFCAILYGNLRSQSLRYSIPPPKVVRRNVINEDRERWDRFGGVRFVNAVSNYSGWSFDESRIVAKIKYFPAVCSRGRSPNWGDATWHQP
jgi:hypothetical protein